MIKRCHITLIVSLLLVSTQVHGQTLMPFTSDGCSAFPDGNLLGSTDQQNLWLSCCIAHDRAYWLGGTETERLQADQALEACVSQVGEPDVAQLMLAGVRVGGSPYWPTSFRWGYGWPYWYGLFPRGYKPLSRKEQQQVLRLLSDQTP